MTLNEVSRPCAPENFPPYHNPRETFERTNLASHTQKTQHKFGLHGGRSCKTSELPHNTAVNFPSGRVPCSAEPMAIKQLQKGPPYHLLLPFVLIFIGCFLENSFVLIFALRFCFCRISRPEVPKWGIAMPWCVVLRLQGLGLLDI